VKQAEEERLRAANEAERLRLVRKRACAVRITKGDLHCT
jgi:hypothetical protein